MTQQYIDQYRKQTKTHCRLSEKVELYKVSCLKKKISPFLHIFWPPSEHSWLSFSNVQTCVPSSSVCLEALEVAKKSSFSVLLASHWEWSLLYLRVHTCRTKSKLGKLLSDIADELISCLIMVEVKPFNPTKESTFLIWYFVSGRVVGINKVCLNVMSHIPTKHRILTSSPHLEDKIFLYLTGSAQSFILFHIPEQRKI